MQAVLFAMGNPFVTGTVLHVDGSRRSPSPPSTGTSVRGAIAATNGAVGAASASTATTKGPAATTSARVSRSIFTPLCSG
ncbi:hypothetical protein [Streptomyces anandii]|uniref:hypothetical protein n=1 Tax=Streptomyces anandii TaxID=285454 RepID=UPI001672C466|nr:hypothetical protein [Streptomyces anandii]GGY12022.1 hypothetical protein GCM10010510_67560 [Streptomyces anandii JCM 4720]